VYDFGTWEVLSHLYTGLTRQVPGTYDYELALAGDVQISDDRLTYTFTLRADATFTDGTPITALTFVDSITRVLALRRDAALAITPYVASVEAAESGELVFTLTRPVPYFLALVSLPPYFPQHPDLASTDQPQPFNEIQTGNGPYLLAEFTIRDQIVLQANPDYAYGPQAQTPTIVLRRYERSLDLREALRNHEIDIAWHALFAGHLIELETEAPEGLHFIEQPSTRVFYLYFNPAREPFDDPSAREAITLLIERGGLVEDFEHGHMSALTSLVPPEFPDAYAPLWPDEFAFEQAENVLHAAGYRTRGQSQLQFGVGYSEQTYGLAHVNTFTQLIRQMFNVSDYISAGLFTDIETPALISQMERGEVGTSMFFAWTPVVPHPDAYLRPLAHEDEPIPQNGGYSAPQIARLLDDAALLGDPAAQGALYREVAERLLIDHALVPLFQDHVSLVAWDDIGGIQIEGNYFLHYDLLLRE
jgi:ABC-type transport system substrate-binding protein